MQPIDQLGRGYRLAWVHPHVQRTVPLETETALGLVELRRADAEVQKHPSQLSGAIQSASSAKFPRRISKRPAYSASRRIAASMAAPSRSQPYSHPLGLL